VKSHYTLPLAGGACSRYRSQKPDSSGLLIACCREFAASFSTSRFTLVELRNVLRLRSVAFYKRLLVDVGLVWIGLVLPRPTVKSIAIAWRFIKKTIREPSLTVCVLPLSRKDVCNHRLRQHLFLFDLRVGVVIGLRLRVCTLLVRDSLLSILTSLL
jgi:hypothetical protein